MAVLAATTISCQANEANTDVTTDPDKQIDGADTVRRERFASLINYEKYKVAMFSGNSVNIDYLSNRTATRFRSAINSSIEKYGFNFGGYYNLTRWSCGTACINGAITDLRTGRVYDLPPATLDYEFQNDSRLLIVNPPDSTGYYEYCSYCEPELWVWNESKKKFEKLN